MTRARKELVSLADTPYYHCVCRCVRRAFLWGTDPFSGQDYSHRKQWVVDRLNALSHVFAIEVCAYAVMSNHYHVVVRIDAKQAKAWTEQEVMARWAALFHLPILLARYRNGQTTCAAEKEAAGVHIAALRDRLQDLSWFMRCLNEDLARRANAEDGCKGRFWERRFKSQALLDEAGLLTCMAYVDLNPIRAGMAATPEGPEFTSIHQRIVAITTANTDTNRSTVPALPLAPFQIAHTNTQADTALPFARDDYLELVDWSGRAIRDGKRGHIEVDPKNWTAR